jgi:hypothetical protein
MAGIVIGVGLSSEIRVDSLFLGMVIFEAEDVELELLGCLAIILSA